MTQAAIARRAPECQREMVEEQPSLIFDRIDRLLAAQTGSPLLVVDLEIVRTRYSAICALFPETKVFYAVKANPEPAVIAALAQRGANFDLASQGEINRCLDLGITADRLSFGNTIKRETEIARARARGIDLFAFDSGAEIEKLARAAVGARVFCRLLVESKGAEWPLSRKFGCSATMAIELLKRAKTLGLRPVGVSFHVGSQQTDPQQWLAPIRTAAEIFLACARAGVALDFLNLGGGLRGHYRGPVPPIATYAEVIHAALMQHFGGSQPQVVIEPGRYLVADAGILRSTVLLVACKTLKTNVRWVYLDAGRYNGLAETQGERIHYRLRTRCDGAPAGPVIIAGPTLRQHRYYLRSRALPAAARSGDRRSRRFSFCWRLHGELRLGGVQWLPACSNLLHLTMRQKQWPDRVGG
jgi:ornithine decarboxylase